MRKTLISAVAIAGVLAIGLAGGAVARDLIGSGDIRDGSVRSPDLRDGGVHGPDLADQVKNRIDVGRVTRLEADGPYPGASDLGDYEGQGDNSDELVKAGEKGTVWVQCAPGKLALGGGFTLAADAGKAAEEAVHVVASYPTQVKDGAMVYEQIAGDDAGSYRPNAWAVDAINQGDTDVVVRPWVVCANVSQR